jgi:hypothetical protein
MGDPLGAPSSGAFLQNEVRVRAGQLHSDLLEKGGVPVAGPSLPLRHIRRDRVEPGGRRSEVWIEGATRHEHRDECGRYRVGYVLGRVGATGEETGYPVDVATIKDLEGVSVVGEFGKKSLVRAVLPIVGSCLLIAPHAEKCLMRPIGS